MSEPTIHEYNQEVLAGLKRLHDLGDQGIAQMQQSMSILLYRLNKILAFNHDSPTAKKLQEQGKPLPPKALGQPVRALLLADMKTHPDIAALPQMQRALEYLCVGLELMANAMVDRVTAGVMTPLLLPNGGIDRDDLYMHQNPALRETNKPYSTWGRPLPFRPLFCKLATFALCFPIRPDAKRYEDMPGDEDAAPLSPDDKPKGRMDKQRSFATLLDAIDYMTEVWKAPLKSETAFIAGSPEMDALAQKPRRIGNCYWRKPKGSISPDLVIVKQRKTAPTQANVTHCVDMKFGDDDVSRDQVQNYLDVFPDRLYVLYFPRECMTGDPGEKQSAEENGWVSLLVAILLRKFGLPRLPRIPMPHPVPTPAF